MFVRALNKLTISLTLLCVSVGLPVFAEQSQLAINWEFAQVSDSLLGKELNIHPLTEQAIELEPQERITLKLKRGQHLFIRFLDENGSPVSESDYLQFEEFQQYQLTSLLSEAPGAAYEVQVSPEYPHIHAASFDRAVVLNNARDIQLNFAVLLGSEVRMNDFAPISWQVPDNGESSQFENNVQQHNDYWRNEVTNTFELEAGKDYWIESLLPASERWQFARSEYFHLHREGQPTKLIQVFESQSRNRFIYDDDQRLRPALPSVFSVDEATEDDAEMAEVKTIGNPYYRIQALQNDWLFSGNYEQLSQPAVRQRQELNEFSRNHKMAEVAEGEKSIVQNSRMHAALNQYLTNKTMTARSAQALKEVYLNNESYRWSFDKSGDTDIATHRVTIPDLLAHDAFTLLEVYESIEFNAPVDAKSNRLILETGFPKLSDSPFAIEVYVDDEYFTTVRSFFDERMERYIVDTDWHLVDDKESDATASITRHTLYIPRNWQTLTLKGASGIIPVRVRYQIDATPRLDGEQWKAWLQPVPEVNSADVYEHPHWQEYARYLEVKSQQFYAQHIHDFWQQWLRDGVFPLPLFESPIPASLPDLQAIQVAFAKPDNTSWQFYLDLYSRFLNSGWDAYGVSLLKAIVRFHTEPKIAEQAAGKLLAVLSEQANIAEQTNLLIAIYGDIRFSNEARRSAQLGLAKLFLTLNRPDYALFSVGKMMLDHESDDIERMNEGRNYVINQSAKALGFPMLQRLVDEQTKALPDMPWAPEKENINYTFVSQVRSQAIVDLENAELNVPQRNYLVTPTTPMTVHTLGATQLQITARQWHTYKHDLNDWVTLKFKNEFSRLPIFYSDFRSETLINPNGSVGSGHRFTVTVPSDGELQIKANGTPMLIHIRELVAPSQKVQVERECNRQNTENGGVDFWNSTDSPRFECVVLHIAEGSYRSFDVKPHYMPSLNQEINRIIDRVFDFEQLPSRIKLTALNKALNALPESRFKGAMTRRANQNADWQAVKYPLQTKKFNFYSTTTNEPISPQAVRGRMLFLPYEKQWERLSESSSLNYDLIVSEGEKFRLVFKAQQHLFQREAATRIDILIDNQLFSSIELVMGQGKVIDLPLMAGNRKLTLVSQTLKGIDSVLAKLQFQRGGDQWLEQPQQVRLRLFQADEQEPFQVFLPEDSWLRIDSFAKNGLANHQYLYAPKGTFSWFDESEAFIGHRMLVLNLVENDSRDTDKRLGSALDLYPDTTRNGYEILQNSRIEEEPTVHSYTWGAQLGMQQQRSASEDAAQNNRFYELQLFAQDSDADNRYFYRYQLDYRNYDSALEDSLHARFNWWDTQWLGNWGLHVGLNLHGQKGYIDDDWAHSARLNINTHWQYSINRRFFNRFSVGVFGNFIESGNLLGQYATSVYSQYKLDHPYGFSISENIRYKWYHDLESWVQLSLTSNELSDSEIIDNTDLQIGTRLYYKGLAADIAYRWREFFQDDNRVTDTTDERLGIGLEWFDWEQAHHWRIRGGFDRNLSENENYWYINLSYNESGYRGVSDYLPQALSFEAMRAQEAALQAINEQNESTSRNP